MSTFKLKTLSITNGGKHKSFQMDFANSNVVYGPNWAGKSTIREAILIGLFGHQVTPIGEFITHGQRNYKVVLELSDGTVITRTKDSATVEEAGEAVAVGQTAVNQYLQLKFETNYEQFSLLNTLSFDTIGSFLDLQGAQFTKLTSHLLGLEKADAYLSGINSEVYRINTILSNKPEFITSASGKRWEVSRESVASVGVELQQSDMELSLLTYDRIKCCNAVTRLEADLKECLRVREEASNRLACARKDKGLYDKLNALLASKEEEWLSVSEENPVPYRNQLQDLENLFRTSKVKESYASEAFQSVRAKQDLYEKTELKLQELSSQLLTEPPIQKQVCTDWLAYRADESAYKIVKGKVSESKLKMTEAEVAHYEATKKLESLPEATDTTEAYTFRADLQAQAAEKLRLLDTKDTCHTCGQTLPHGIDKELVARQMEDLSQSITQLTEFIEAQAKLQEDRQLALKAVNDANLTLSKATSIFEEHTRNLNAVKVPDYRVEFSELETIPNPFQVVEAYLNTYKQNEAVQKLIDGLLANRPEPVDKVVMAKIRSDYELSKLEASRIASEVADVTTRLAIMEAESARANRLRQEITAIQNQLKKLEEGGLLTLIDRDERELAVLDQRAGTLTTDVIQGKTGLNELNLKVKDLENKVSSLHHLEKQLKIELDSQSELTDKLTKLKKLSQIIKNLKEVVSTEGLLVLNREASEFASTVSSGVIEAVNVSDKFSFIEDGVERSKDRASGGQKSILALAIKSGLRALSPCKLDLLILDEALGTLQDGNSEAIMDVVHNQPIQTFSITHRVEVAEQVITLN